MNSISQHMELNPHGYYRGRTSRQRLIYVYYRAVVAKIEELASLPENKMVSRGELERRARDADLWVGAVTEGQDLVYFDDEARRIPPSERIERALQCLLVAEAEADECNGAMIEEENSYLTIGILKAMVWLEAKGMYEQ